MQAGAGASLQAAACTNEAEERGEQKESRTDGAKASRRGKAENTQRGSLASGFRRSVFLPRGGEALKSFARLAAPEVGAVLSSAFLVAAASSPCRRRTPRPVVGLASLRRRRARRPPPVAVPPARTPRLSEPRLPLGSVPSCLDRLPHFSASLSSPRLSRPFPRRPDTYHVGPVVQQRGVGFDRPRGRGHPGEARRGRRSGA